MAPATAAAKDIPRRFEQAGFTVNAPQADRLEVSKSGFTASLEHRAGNWVREGPSYLVVHGIPCELEDRGYQKFWFSKSQGTRFPIRKVELGALHRFDDEVRYILGATTLYNQALGSVNARTVYDRLNGRSDR